MSRSALVIGGGIAGLASAIALRQAGWQVDVLERAPRFDAVGGALSLWPNAVAALRRLGLADRLAHRAAPLRRMLLRTQAGTTLIDRAVTDALLPTRALLQEVLLDALPDLAVRFDTAVARLISADAGIVTLTDGTTRAADLVIAADGIHSALAVDLLGTRSHYCGYAGVIALSDPLADRQGTGLAAEYWGRHERYGVFDLGCGRRYWFHMRTQRAEAALPDHAALSAGLAAWPAEVAAAVRATPPDRLIPWPLYAKPAPRRLGRGRVLVVGDAAHAMEPNLGQGACQALEDAVALGVAAATDQPLATFEQLRLSRARTFVKRSGEGRLAVHGPAPVQSAMRCALRLLPAVVQERTIAGLQTLPPYTSTNTVKEPVRLTLV